MKKVDDDYYEEYAQHIDDSDILDVREEFLPYLSNITSDFNALYSHDGYINLFSYELGDLLNDRGALNYKRGVYRNGAVRILENELMKFAITTEALPPRNLRFGGRFRVRTRNN